MSPLLLLLFLLLHEIDTARPAVEPFKIVREQPERLVGRFVEKTM